MATSADDGTRKRLALAIIDFLNTSVDEGALPADDRDSIEVAINCIAESFKVDPAEAAASVPQNQKLLAIYSTYEKLKGRSTPSTQGSSSAAEARPSTPKTPGPKPPTTGGSSTVKNAEAENLKGQGNVAMQAKNYQEAVRFYTQAIEISPTNPIYLSNRAAAYSAMKQHEPAKQDAEMAVASDPKYTKAWSRLGLARYALGDAKGSMEAYQSGIDAEGNGGSEAMRKGYETAKKRVEELGLDADDDSDELESNVRAGPGAGTGAGAGGMPDFGSMFGGGGGGGGMPDLAGLMNNPMMRQMASNLMSNPDMMNNLMSNPRLREMANSFGGGGGGGSSSGGGRGGGGMPDMASLMQDPSIAEMARNFMGGMGGGAGGAGAGGADGAGRGSGRGSSS